MTFTVSQIKELSKRVGNFLTPFSMPFALIELSHLITDQLYKEFLIDCHQKPTVEQLEVFLEKIQPLLTTDGSPEVDKIQKEIETEFQEKPPQHWIDLSVTDSSSLSLRQLVSLQYALAKLAEIKIKENDPELAQRYFNEALKFQQESLSHTKPLIDRQINNKIRGMKGAAGKKRRYAPIKKKLISLLEEHKPKNGWTSKSKASISLAPALLEFEIKYLTDNGTPQKAIDKLESEETNIEIRISNWLHKDKDVSAAFEKFSEPKRSEK